MLPTKKRLLKIAILVIVIFSAAYGVLFSLRFALGTEFPVVIVNGVSMIPTYYEGDLLVVQGVPDKNMIEVQEIIVFHNPYSWDILIVHRVVEVRNLNEQLIFRTKGDNNVIQDHWQVREEHIVGRVLQKIPYMGGVVTAIQSPYGIGILYSLIVVVIVFELFYSKKTK
ncbi:MAG: signal peptidase I [Candidatus Bathyarchaeia archaeon]